MLGCRVSHMNTFPMEDKVLELVAHRFHVLGETYRLRILQLLKQRARNVGELVNELNGNQPNVSKHLQILRQAGIVDRRRDGNSVIYSLKDRSVWRLCELVQQNEQPKLKRGRAVGGFIHHQNGRWLPSMSPGSG
jgi:DNA-binding transcriptional ArsR family regulator